MAEVEVVEINPDDIEIVGVVGGATGGGGSGATKLDDLSDVDGATAGLTGQVLVKEADGQWRPAVQSGGGGTAGPLSYLHTQDSLSTVWLINHDLPFQPSGIEVHDHLGARHFPVVSWPEASTVRLDFITSVRGTARLS